MATTLLDEILSPTLVQTLDHGSSATFQKSLSGRMTLSTLYKTKFASRPFLEHSNLHSPILNISQESGEEIVMMNDFLESLLQE